MTLIQILAVIYLIKCADWIFILELNKSLYLQVFENDNVFITRNNFLYLHTNGNLSYQVCRPGSTFIQTL